MVIVLQGLRVVVVLQGLGAHVVVVLWGFRACAVIAMQGHCAHVFDITHGFCGCVVAVQGSVETLCDDNDVGCVPVSSLSCKGSGHR